MKNMEPKHYATAPSGPSPEKSFWREKLKRDTAEFEARGGKINYCDSYDSFYSVTLTENQKRNAKSLANIPAWN